MRYHPEVMTRAQQTLLAQLGPFASERRFYLGGGTAVALQLGHRRSEDLDWFTPEPLGDPLLLAQALRDFRPDVASVATSRGTLHGQVGEVRVGFIEYRYPLLEPPLHWPEYGCDLASMADLACMKLAAVAQRGAKRDFLDVYALAKAFASLDQMVTLYRRRYGIDDVTHLLYALSYFDDADSEPTPILLWPIDWAEVKADVRRWVREQS